MCMAQNIHYFQEFGWLKQWALGLKEGNFSLHSFLSLFGEHPNPTVQKGSLPTYLVGDIPCSQDFPHKSHKGFPLQPVQKNFSEHGSISSQIFLCLVSLPLVNQKPCQAI
nr:hypothetical protein Iba_chr02bCG9230 [Ipomoea batatas]